MNPQDYDKAALDAARELQIKFSIERMIPDAIPQQYPPDYVAVDDSGIAAIWYLVPVEDRTAPISLLHVGGALLIALGTGFLFSLYPAWKASRFDPIEALHYE